MTMTHRIKVTLEISDDGFTDAQLEELLDNVEGTIKMEVMGDWGPTGWGGYEGPFVMRVRTESA